MIHYTLYHHPGGHYGMNINCKGNCVLLQIGNEMEQVRIALTPLEVNHLARQLQQYKRKVIKNERKAAKGNTVPKQDQRSSDASRRSAGQRGHRDSTVSTEEAW